MVMVVKMHLMISISITILSLKRSQLSAQVLIRFFAETGVSEPELIVLIESLFPSLKFEQFEFDKEEDFQMSSICVITFQNIPEMCSNHGQRASSESGCEDYIV
ncbi:MAG: hypothetical protein EZS28_008471 [Streblomastix strix]|uniref:Uncharacterized protein n=1 Tax=Streblomastix strix TaxID=222440 RepID=A0A5J4WM94_9EUKA|nr:MAG: hypothetical protein EZS28_008471 [Streblomastix strix]